MPYFYVYILTNQYRGTLYVGSTSELIRRVWEHKQAYRSSFTAKYQVNRLIYYEIYQEYTEAARREKRFKYWQRCWKIDLVESFNPTWRDLYDEICTSF